MQAVSGLQSKLSTLEKEIQQLKKEAAKNIKSDLLQAAKDVNGMQIIAQKVDIDDNAIIKDLVFQLKNESGGRAVILGAVINNKPVLTIGLSDDLVKEKGLNAGQLVREAAKEMQGGGGGQPFFATAGGKNPQGIDNAITKAIDLIGK